MSFSALPDSSKLRQILVSITSELDSSFLERRGRKHSHKQNPLDELSDAISELAAREQDLKAAAGIALMLLETNEDLQEKVAFNDQKLQESEARCHHYIIQVETLANSLALNEEKLEKVKSQLMKAEENIFAQAQYIQLLSERKKESKDVDSDEQIYELQRSLEKMNEKNQELERNNLKLTQKIANDQESRRGLEEKIRELEYKIKLMQQKLEAHRNRHSSLVSELESSESNREACESLLKQANSTIQKLKMYTERLEEEMTIHDNKKSATVSHHQNESSLYSELSALENYQEGEESIEDTIWKKSSTSTRFLSIHSFTKSNCVCKGFEISVLGVKNVRKPAPEEYFSLATQAVKMNSPYMESICCVPTSQLYDKAVRDEVPFHKWHEWISKQLGLIYIDIIYKKNAKFSWTKNTQKKFLVSPTQT